VTQQYLTYEHPLNERIRNFLRTEYLFQLAKHRYHTLSSSWDTKDCISAVIELYNLIERTEFKSELLKELERNANGFQRLAKTPAIDQKALDKVMGEIEASSEVLRSYSTKQGLFPKDHELLNGIRQRLSIPGGTCSFDIPSFHYWLHLTPKTQQGYLGKWIEAILPLEKALTLVLNLTRQSSFPTKETAVKGTFQKPLNSQLSCQLIQIGLKFDLGVYPEISASRHRVNIRFLTADYEQGKSALLEQDVPFELNCCAI